jgi:Holliday junction resolvase RusA-like endonuclease
MVYYFTLKLTPVAKERPRFTKRGFAYTPHKTRLYESKVQLAVTYEWGSRKLLNQNLEAIAVFQFKKPRTSKLKYPRQDVDNLFKALADSLNGVLFEDDKQIVKLTASKQWGPCDEITLVITEL